MFEMYNPDHHKGAPVNPRISFSIDFVESHHYQQQQRQSTHGSDRSVNNTDFEFSVSDDPFHSIASADELFFKGRILPLKDTHFPNPPSTGVTTTLGDELQLAAGGDPKPPLKGKWKGFLGLRKSRIDPSGRKDSTTPKRAACSGTNNGFSFPP